MLARASELDGRTLEADLCIVGAGAAGIAVARQFQSLAAWRVVLLESGDLEPDPRIQALYEGDWGSPVGDEEYLLSSRSRTLGGTTTRWSGTCRPHDPIDFEERPWVPNSGWPLRREELEPFYRRAAELLEIAPFDDEGPDGQLLPHDPVAGEGRAAFVPKILHSSPPTRFDRAYAPALIDSDAVLLVLRATVVDIRRAGRESRLVDRVEVASLEGARFTVRARAFVVACGAFENARLLLSSRRDQPEGLGNQHDNVGRYYSDHVHSDPVALLAVTDERALVELSARTDELSRRLGHGHYFVYGPTREAQREHRLLNFGLRMVAVMPEPRVPLDLELARQVQRLSSNLGGGSRRLDERGAGMAFSLRGYPEEVPNRDSRVTLSEDLDALGQRKVAVDWRPATQTRAEFGRILELFAREIGASGRGRICFQLVEGVYDADSGFWNHAAGTTRMHRDPKLGVTDATGLVHGTDNLFVAGSSLFPTAGFVNPMMTIVALALRLAEHLRTSLEVAR